MQRASLLGVAALLASCGGPATQAITQSDFTGAPWDVTLTTSVDCGGGQLGSTSSSGKVGFVALPAPDEIQASSQAGCNFKLNLAGATASLVNAPVVCSATSSGQAYQYSFSSYTATTSDGHNLTISAAATENFAGAVCRFTITGNGHR
jgi:hypothetical protein